MSLLPEDMPTVLSSNNRDSLSNSDAENIITPYATLLTLIANSLKFTVSNLFPQNYVEIILFGSYARGEATEDSDIDMMLLVDASREEIASKSWKIGDVAGELLLKYGILVSPIVENRKYFQDNQEYFPFFRNISLEGVRLLA